MEEERTGREEGKGVKGQKGKEKSEGNGPSLASPFSEC